MEQSNKTPQVTNIEDYEKYMLQSRGEILQKLRQLAKNRSMITAHFSGDSMLTAVIDVISDNNLLVLDYGADETLNKKILEARRIICNTQLDGITAQFTVEKVSKARLKGHQVFACSLPANLLWVQRREAYRVKIPLSSKATLQLTTKDDEIIEFPIIDISATGLALHHNGEHSTRFEAGEHFHGCQLSLDDFGSSIISIEIRNEIPLPEENESRIGCCFIELGSDTSSMIQRYIHMIDAMQRQTI